MGVGAGFYYGRACGGFLSAYIWAVYSTGLNDRRGAGRGYDPRGAAFYGAINRGGA